MKIFPLSILAVSFVLLPALCALKAQNIKEKSAISTLNGGWQRVAVKVNGKIESRGQEFRVYHNGFFSIITQDSAGEWKQTHAGTYEINSNLYKEKLLYCSYANEIGMIHWQEFSIKGDTAIFKLFKKMINYPGDVSALPKIEMVCVRMKSK